MTPLAAFALTFVLSNSPPKLHRDETPLGYVERAAEIADDVATVAAGEPALFAGDDDRRKTASLLLSVAFFESGFQAYADLGDCLKPAWRLTPRGHAMVVAHADCDGMEAGSLWQVHGGKMFEGEMLPEPYELAADRKLAAKMALKMMRIDTSLGAYTGGQLQKARVRRSFAERWWTSHSL